MIGDNSDADDFYLNLFELYDEDKTGELTKYQLEEIFSTIKTGHLSLQQISASIDRICAHPTCMSSTDLKDVLEDMERRFCLMQEIEWEFKLLDLSKDGTVSIENARCLFEIVHGNMFDVDKWDEFVMKRPIPQAAIFLSEIEVQLCDIPTTTATSYKLQRQKRKEAEAAKLNSADKVPGKQQDNFEDATAVIDTSIAGSEAGVKNKKTIRGNIMTSNSNTAAADNVKEKGEKTTRRKSSGKIKPPSSASSTSISDEAKQIIENARDASTLLQCSKALDEARKRRDIKDLEDAISEAKRHGFDKNELSTKVIEACKLLERLKRLERLRNEVLDLKQSTIAELRSYNSPHPAVHTVMTATYLLLGTSEKETKKWTKIQTLLGKTGHEGLKRKIGKTKDTDVDAKTAHRARTLLSNVDLEVIRDISAGAATFYVWVHGMVAETDE